MTTQRARTLRQTATEAEKLLWHGLRDRRLNGLKFRRQQTIDRYVVDFICYENRLIVEADGSQHTIQADGSHTAFLEAQGYRVLRFWNPEILTNLNGVLETILAAAEGRVVTMRCAASPHPPHPNPSPARGEGLLAFSGDCSGCIPGSARAGWGS